jgi:hypothetical protein
MANFGSFDGRPSGVCHRLLSAAATTNGTSVKATAGVVKRVIGTSKAATDRFLKFYDKASAPTVGTDVPIMTILLPPMTAFVLDIDDHFQLGIAYAITGLAADADTTACAAGDIVCLNLRFA